MARVEEVFIVPPNPGEYGVVLFCGGRVGLRPVKAFCCTLCCCCEIPGFQARVLPPGVRL